MSAKVHISSRIVARKLVCEILQQGIPCPTMKSERGRLLGIIGEGRDTINNACVLFDGLEIGAALLLGRTTDRVYGVI